MAERTNPLKLNTLQQKTLALLQAIAKVEGLAEPPDADGVVLIRQLPHAHGDHFHIGSAVVRGSDATGLHNHNVYNVLARKGLILAGPQGMPMLTPAGLAYDTGVAQGILHGSDH